MTVFLLPFPMVNPPHAPPCPIFRLRLLKLVKKMWCHWWLRPWGFVHWTVYSVWPSWSNPWLLGIFHHGKNWAWKNCNILNDTGGIIGPPGTPLWYPCATLLNFPWPVSPANTKNQRPAKHPRKCIAQFWAHNASNRLEMAQVGSKWVQNHDEC